MLAKKRAGSRYSAFPPPPMTWAGGGLVGGCFYRVLNPDASSETIEHPGPRCVTEKERTVTIEVLTVDRKLIFLADITYHPLSGPALGYRPRWRPSTLTAYIIYRYIPRSASLYRCPAEGASGGGWMGSD